MTAQVHQLDKIEISTRNKKKSYCDFVKAYLSIVSITSLKRILDVKV